MKKREILFFVGIVLLIAGAAALVYGLVTYSQLQDDLVNRFTKAFAGSSSQENQALYITIAGAAGVVVGLILLLTNKKKTRKKRKR